MYVPHSIAGASGQQAFGVVLEGVADGVNDGATLEGVIDGVTLEGVKLPALVRELSDEPGVQHANATAKSGCWPYGPPNEPIKRALYTPGATAMPFGSTM